MTREEAITRLEMMFQECSFPQKRCKGDCCTCSMAISALSKVDTTENPKCDLISRADVVNEIQRYERHFNTKLESLYVLINELPSAELPKGDLISRADAIEAVESNKSDWNNDYNRPIEKDIQTLKALPSADAVPQMEHDREWIIGCIKHDGFIHTHRFDKANQIILEALEVGRPSGEWLPSKILNEKYVCSVCGGACWYYSVHGEPTKSNFCPNCGAIMKGGDDE